MPLPKHFTLLEDYACYRPVATVTLQEAVDMICLALTYCRENKIGKLLVNTTQLSGFGPLQTIDRYHLAQQFAVAAQSAVKAVMVARPELIDPDKFGVTVGRNRGLDSNVFTNEPEALQWLLAPPAA